MKASSFLLLLGFFGLFCQQIDAHYHHNTYIIEQPAPAYVVVQPVAPVYAVAQPAQVVVDEEMGVAPGPNYYYIQGGRQWDGCRWHHVHGHWAPRY